ncbi:hypothetical protein D3C85_486060 [compost metagenome]
MPGQAFVEGVQKGLNVRGVVTPLLQMIAGQASHLHTGIGILKAVLDGFFKVIGVLLVFVIGHAGLDARIRPGDDDQVLIDLTIRRRRQPGTKANDDRQTVDAGFTHGPEIAWENAAH